MTLYKVTNQNENHHGFQYQNGLNILQESFNPRPGCQPGGFYCVEKKDLHNFYDFGVWIREVTIPSDAQRVLDTSNGVTKWKSDRLVLGQKYPLFDLNTIKNLGLQITISYLQEALNNNRKAFVDRLVGEGYAYTRVGDNGTILYYPGPDPNQSQQSSQYCPVHGQRFYQEFSGYKCNNCLSDVLPSHSYCSGCGRKLKWR